ncbi:MAG: sigma-70 family RNA polymerase sigma factor [Actinomycetota bacterium]
MPELVDAIRSGDDWAWQALVERLQQPVWGVLSRFQVDQHLKNDAAAETWKTLFEHIDQVREPDRLGGWVGVVAANHLRRMLRRRSSTSTHEDIDMVAFDPALLHLQADPVVERETRSVLDRAVARLSAREQLVVRARAYTDQPVPLAALGAGHAMPTGSIGPTLGRGVEKLRRDPEIMTFFERPSTPGLPRS